MSNDDLIAEALEVLQSVYGPRVPHPVECAVTRWASDKFARGSYSFAGIDMRPDDYDIMSRPIGNLFFAGEHTTGTHPATVHGAYLTGLRVASEVVEALLGPIEVPVPLIIPRDIPNPLKRKASRVEISRLFAEEAAGTERTIHSASDATPLPNVLRSLCRRHITLFVTAYYEHAREICSKNRSPKMANPAPMRCMQ